jgi:hypothetical protein
MATYKGIQGFGVETLASDPTEPGSVGQIFYNSTSGTFKTVKPGGLPIGTWASGGDRTQLEFKEELVQDLDHKWFSNRKFTIRQAV